MSAYNRLTAMLAEAGSPNAGDTVLRQLVPERLAKQCSIYPTTLMRDGQTVLAVAVEYISQKRGSHYRAMALQTGQTIVLAGEGSQTARAFANALERMPSNV